ncbi:MAG: PfkB family carbohydrate kinase [Paracoccaceae bacterium]
MSLVVAGALHWDVVVRAPSLPRLDETLKGGPATYRLGGKGGNQALAAARAGARVTFWGRVGSDAPGETMRAALTDGGVDASQLQSGPGASGMSVAIETPRGYGAVIVAGENHALDLSALSLPPRTEILLCQNELAAGAWPHMAGLARAAGAQAWLNAAPAHGIDVGLADVLIVNRVEAADLGGAGALRAVAPGAHLIVTLGAKGVVHHAPGADPVAHPARPAWVVSTHGAGDAFCGTLAARRLAGASWPDAIGAAQDAASALISTPR